jgi:PleD family two-component response regulator
MRAGLRVPENRATGRCYQAMLFDHVLQSDGGISPSTVKPDSRRAMSGAPVHSGTDDWAEPAAKASVLLVIDQVSAGNELALKRANCRAVSAINGLITLILLNKNPFDLILLDINMPRMNGIELCQTLAFLTIRHTCYFVTRELQSRAKVCERGMTIPSPSHRQADR